MPAEVGPKKANLQKYQADRGLQRPLGHPVQTSPVEPAVLKPMMAEAANVSPIPVVERLNKFWQ
jgi:hypothetical protein